MIKKPSAWVPIALSLAILVFILTYIALFGITAPEPDADEGTPARLFQLWMVVEFLMIAYFAARWLPQMPKQALFILAVQIIAALAACSPVFILGL